MFIEKYKVKKENQLEDENVEIFEDRALAVQRAEELNKEASDTGLKFIVESFIDNEEF